MFSHSTSPKINVDGESLVKKRLWNGALASALTAGLILGGATAANAVAVDGQPVNNAQNLAAACVPDNGESVTRSFYEAPRTEINEYYEYFHMYREDYLTTTLPEAITEVDVLFGGETPTATKHVLTDVVPMLFEKYATAVAATEPQAEAAGGISSEILREALLAYYAFEQDLTSAIAEAYSEDKLWEIQRGWTHEQRLDLVRAMSLRLIGGLPELHSAYMEIDTEMWVESGAIPEIYDELHAGFVASGISSAEAETRTYNAIYDATLAWVKRVDLDYLRGYQGQLQQYVAMAQAADMVVDADPDARSLVIDVGQPGVHEFTLGDFTNENFFEFSVNNWFFDVNFNEAAGEFYAPEEVYEFEEYQALVAEVMAPLEGIRGGAHGRASVVEAAIAAINEQYDALEAPGSASQPITYVYTDFNYAYFQARNRVFDELSDGTLATFPDWRDENGDIVYDTYRAQNYIDVPYVELAQSGTQTVTREVSFRFEDGAAIDAAGNPVTQTADFACMIDLYTGEAEWVQPDETHTFPAVNVPAHPAANATVRAVDANLGELVVKPGDESSVLDVVLPLDFSVDVQFVDTAGKQIRDADRMSGRWNTDFTAVAPDIPGYVLSAVSAVDVQETRNAVPNSVTGVFNAETTTVTFEYVVVTDAETPGTGGEETPGSGTTAPGTKTPVTGAALAYTGGSSLLGAGLGALALLAAGSAFMIRRHSRS